MHCRHFPEYGAPNGCTRCGWESRLLVIPEINPGSRPIKPFWIANAFGENLALLDFQVVEAVRTPELNEYLDLIAGAVNYVNQTFSLFKAAQERRPSKLVEPVKRK